MSNALEIGLSIDIFRIVFGQSQILKEKIFDMSESLMTVRVYFIMVAHSEDMCNCILFVIYNNLREPENF